MMPLSMPVTSFARCAKRHSLLCWIQRGGFQLMLPLLLALAVVPARAQQEIRVGVLGLFHPRELVLEQEAGQVLSIVGQGVDGNPVLVLNGEPGHRQLVFRAEGGRVVAGSRTGAGWRVTARGGGAVAFRLTVPGKLRRVYFGRFNIQIHNGQLLPVVSIGLETAVASIVAAEMMESAPMEALKAQAVATRSFLAAGPRHLEFDSCDTTHCQFLKSPPPVTSRVSRAVEATRGLVIAYRDKPLAAMYSSRCGGQTYSLRDVGADPGDGYPYFGVHCAWCRQHPFTWRSAVGTSAHSPEPRDEHRRITEARQWGWGAIPGSDFTATKDGAGWRLEGHSVGHGVGMCQHGAAGMAVAGASFRQILAHFYPNTVLIAEP